jgi:aminoglycoside phosphotransferase family enzyme
VREVEAIETHMSWVFLTEAHVFKLKKPIRTPWLDHSTLERRKRACELELSLNRRLAPDVYLAVVPLLRDARQPCVEQPGPPSDWLVKMRRLPRERMLDVEIAARAVTESDVDRLAATLARFYLRAERVPLEGPAYGRLIGRELAAKRESVEQARYGLSSSRIRALAEAQDRWLARHGALLEARGASIVDAHGDLRPEHVCVDARGSARERDLEDSVAVIDCLEFDRGLRLLDPVSELSFLALECTRLGAPWIGPRLLSGYAARTSDRADPELVRFYASYHALVRAAVAAWHLDDPALDATEKWRRRSEEYLALADTLGRGGGDERGHEAARTHAPSSPR